MKNMLSASGGEVLLDVARRRPLLVFDFDGTLAPLVSDPARAAMRESTAGLLGIAALLYPCAVVSGRRRADVAGRLAGVPLAAVVGNHGAEAGFGPVDRSPGRQVVAWREALARDLAGAPGIALEDKGLSLAVHYRHAPERLRARRAILAAVARLPGSRVFGGKAVVNVVPQGSHDKGDAVAALLRRTDRTTAVYVGDDATDEDAFRNRAVSLGVRVGRTHLSAARYYIPSQRDTDELLRELIRARRRLEGLPEDIAGLERSMEHLRSGAGRRAG